MEKEEENGEEIGDILDYLQRFHMQKESDELMLRIKLAESNGDLEKLQELLAEKVEISRRMHGEVADI